MTMGNPAARFGARPTDDTPHAEHGTRRGADPSVLETLTPSLTAILEHLAHLHRVVASTAGVARKGALATPIRPGSFRVVASAGTLAGWSLHETTGAAGAVVRLHDGVDTSGDVVAAVSLAAGADSTRWLLPHGVGFAGGLFCEVVSGAVEGALYTGPWA